MTGVQCVLVTLVVITCVQLSVGVLWERLRCSSDAIQSTPEGIVPDIGRFPWIGIVQHNFYMAGRVHFAITGAVLIHPAFAIAAAEDIAKINPGELKNNTKLILWGSATNKYALDVMDYILHPQYHDGVTYATIALLDLVGWNETPDSEWKAPVLPICMPMGAGLFTDMYAVKLTDANKEMQKEVLKMKFVGDQDCEEFYYKAQLSFAKTNPVNPLCAVSETSKTPCVWDAGTALITRQSWGFWKLLGFALRGPGCGAPTRFLNIHDYLPWINDVITRRPEEDSEDIKIAMRRASPYTFFMYKAGARVPPGLGQCARHLRGEVLYKDTSEFVTNRYMVQGFFYVMVSQIANFRCVEVKLDVTQRTNAAIWLEHDCHPDVMGLAYNQFRPAREKMTCFVYFKTSAYVEVRFMFSFTAIVEVTLFGKEESPRIIPNPFKSSQHTTAWWPTGGKIAFGKWAPENLGWWDL